MTFQIRIGKVIEKRGLNILLLRCESLFSMTSESITTSVLWTCCTNNFTPAVILIPVKKSKNSCVTCSPPKRLSRKNTDTTELHGEEAWMRPRMIWEIGPRIWTSSESILRRGSSLQDWLFKSLMVRNRSREEVWQSVRDFVSHKSK